MVAGPEPVGPMLSLAKSVKLAENPTELSYAKLPVEDFGKAMMRKMGWTEGTGIGRNPQKGLVQPIEYLPRHHRLGLGATPLPTMKINGGAGSEAPSQREKGALRSVNYKYLDEKLAVKGKFAVGAEVLINKGRHEGMYGRIVGIHKKDHPDPDTDDTGLYIELLANDQVVPARI